MQNITFIEYVPCQFIETAVIVGFTAAFGRKRAENLCMHIHLEMAGGLSYYFIDK
jgi:hypothetical protein